MHTHLAQTSILCTKQTFLVEITKVRWFHLEVTKVGECEKPYFFYFILKWISSSFVKKLESLWFPISGRTQTEAAFLHDTRLRRREHWALPQQAMPTTDGGLKAAQATRWRHSHSLISCLPVTVSLWKMKLPPSFYSFRFFPLHGHRLWLQIL